MTSGRTTTEADLIRVLRLLRGGCSRSVIAFEQSIHRETVAALIDQAALRWLARWEADRAAERLDDLTDAH